jgi:hypothetical protein
MVLVFGSLMASAMFHGLLVSGQSDLDHLDSQIQIEKRALAQEKLDLANLQSPARIAQEARDLGMVPADQQHWVTPGSTDDPVVTGRATDPTDPTDQTDQTDQSGQTDDPQELAGTGTGGAAQ